MNGLVDMRLLPTVKTLLVIQMRPVLAIQTAARRMLARKELAKRSRIKRPETC